MDSYFQLSHDSVCMSVCVFSCMFLYSMVNVCIYMEAPVCDCAYIQYNLYVYIIESVRLFVCLFVRGKRQNYGTD